MTPFMKDRLRHLIREAFLEGAICVAHNFTTNKEDNLMEEIETRKLEVEKQSTEAFEMYENWGQ